MPIIKSSTSGEAITVIVFDAREIEALVTLLSSASITLSVENKRALSILEDMFFAFNIPNPAY